MPTLDWLARDAAFRVAEAVPTRVLRPHPAAAQLGDLDGVRRHLALARDNAPSSPQQALYGAKLDRLRAVP